MKAVDGMKFCPKCQTLKVADQDFHRNWQTADGYQHWCRDCLREAIKKSRAKNRERHLARMRERNGGAE